MNFLGNSPLSQMNALMNMRNRAETYNHSVTTGSPTNDLKSLASNETQHCKTMYDKYAPEADRVNKVILGFICFCLVFGVITFSYNNLVVNKESGQ